MALGHYRKIVTPPVVVDVLVVDGLVVDGLVVDGLVVLGILQKLSSSRSLKEYLGSCKCQMELWKI